MIDYRRPAPPVALVALACGHPGRPGSLCQHRSHVHNVTPAGVTTAPREVVRLLRRGDSVVISRGTA